MKSLIAKYWLGVSALAFAIATPQLAVAAKTPANIIAGGSVPWVTQTEAGAAGAKPAKYRSKTFTFPVGTIQILEFKKATGGVLHKVASEKELYVVKGAAEVGVKDGTESLAAGDAVNLPTGTLQSPANDVEDTTVVLFTVPNASAMPVASAVHGKDAKVMPPPAGPAQNGVPAAAITLNVYGFDGNSIRVVSFKKPGSTPPTAHDTDSVIYLLSGKMKFTTGGVTTLVKAGDAVHEVAGIPSSWDVLEDATFVSTSATIAPSGAK